MTFRRLGVPTHTIFFSRSIFCVSPWIGGNPLSIVNLAGKFMRGHFESLGGCFIDVLVRLALVQGFHDVSYN